MGRHRFPLVGLGRRGTNEKLAQFQYLVAQLDSIRAFRRIHPSKLEEPVMKTGTTNLWNRIRPGVEKIVFLPETIPGMASLIRTAATLRMLFPLCFFSFILGILIRVGIFAVASSALYNIFLIAPIVIMLAFVVVDFTIRKRVARYEEKHPDLHVEEKEQIKRAVEELIWKLRGDYSILIVTHNMAQARRASEECVFMLLGKIIEHGQTDEMFLTPKNKETADYIEGRYG